MRFDPRQFPYTKSSLRNRESSGLSNAFLSTLGITELKRADATWRIEPFQEPDPDMRNN
jgi:hypothetical protein